jgi:hypothetical protein
VATSVRKTLARISGVAIGRYPEGRIAKVVGRAVAVGDPVPAPPVRGLRCLESTIEPGERVAIYGRGVREASREPAAAGYRETPSRLVFRAGRQVPLLVSDRPQTLR